MATTPRVSIGLPVYNGANYLADAIESLLSQTFSDFELIISSNASTDDTDEICRRYAAKDPRIHYSRLAQNVGAAGNYNYVFHQSRGAYFKWAAHDDICRPTFLERCVNTLDAAPPGVALCMPGTVLIDALGHTIKDHDDNLDLRHTRAAKRMASFGARIWASGCHSVFGLIRSDLLRKTRLIGSFVASDVVLLGELAAAGELWEIPDRLFCSRIHAACSHQIKSPEEYAAWFNPSGARRSARFVRTRIVVEQLRSLSIAAPLSPLGKISSAAAFTTAWCWRQARVDGGAARRALADRLCRWARRSARGSEGLLPRGHRPGQAANLGREVPTAE